MALHPQARAVLDAMAALGEPPIHEDTPAAARARREARIRPPMEEIHERRDVDAGFVSMADLIDDGQAALTAAGRALAAALA